MDRVYREIPYNYDKIEKYVITNRDDIVNEILRARRCYWYDTCAFRKHMEMPCGQLIAKYIKETSGIIVITRTILMELCSADGQLWNEHIVYIEHLVSQGIKVLLIYEEDLFDVLYTYSSEIAEINQWLSRAVKCAKSKVGKIEETIRSNNMLHKFLYEGVLCKDTNLARKLFSAVRAAKASGDNMGEELLAVCVHWLSRMRDKQSYKYIILTDDKKSIPVFGKVMKNVSEYYEVESVTLCTTVKLCYLMVQNGVVSRAEEVGGILKEIVEQGSLKVCYSGEFELKPLERTMTLQGFEEAIFKNKIKVYY